MSVAFRCDSDEEHKELWFQFLICCPNVRDGARRNWR